MARMEHVSLTELGKLAAEGQVEAEVVGMVGLGDPGVETNHVFVQTLQVKEPKSFTPQFHAALEPDFVLEFLGARCIGLIFRVPVGFYPSLQQALGSGQITGHGFCLGFDQQQLFGTHQAPVSGIGIVNAPV